MVNAAKLRVPLAVTLKQGHNWQDMKELA